MAPYLPLVRSLDVNRLVSEIPVGYDDHLGEDGRVETGGPKYER